MKTPYSSAVCSRRVVSRHDTRRRDPLKTPILVLVLPTSMTSSIGGLHGHVTRDDSQRLANVRPQQQRAVVSKVARAAFPSGPGPRPAPDALGTLEPCLADPVDAGG